ncbi:hypothetical protein J6TS2_07410 [Heyndrickxia sporothermodurans]|nr:hypothetical protein J6TS2_07410 [Heyndrickxia sporothermodurans]
MIPQQQTFSTVLIPESLCLKIRRDISDGAKTSSYIIEEVFLCKN